MWTSVVKGKELREAQPEGPLLARLQRLEQNF